jgi:broad specificity phosphatase PhoE
MIQPGVTVYFVRHGQTPWNARHLAQGHTDNELNEHGREQAQRNGARLSALIADPLRLDFVSSPLRRATETMEILRTGIGLPRHGYRTDPRLREMSFGVSEGSSWPEYAQRLIDGERERGIEAWTFAADGGESYADLTARALPVFREIARDTVVTCHGGISRCLQVALAGMKPTDVIASMVPQDKIMVLRGGALMWE